MSKLELRPATPEDCAELAVTMRQADRTELALGGSPSPYDALMRGVVRSENPTAVVGPHGDVVAIGGVVTLAPTAGCPWLLASDGLMDIKWRFLRECRPKLESIHGTHPLLINEVWEGNHVHIRWLRWLGFTVSDTPSRPHFLPFWRHQHV